MNISEIEKAALRIKGHANYTPLLNSPMIDEIAGRRVLIKAECLQKTGSFKFRGAWSAVSMLSEAQLAAGVVAFSSGNHAQGVALAARAHGAKAVIVMPHDVPALKAENTRALGAEVVFYNRDTESRDAIGARLAQEQGLTLIKPFDNEMVIAGQGTVGLELAQQAAELGVESADVLVCCGGGGLTSGIALALADKAPKLRVRPVEPVGFDDVIRSIASGEICANAQMSGSICDAIITQSPGNLTFPILKTHCGAGIAVCDEDCLRAMAQAFLYLKLVAEPGGAIALAAALYHADQIEGDTVICVVSGGNVDPDMFARALNTL